MKVAGIKLFGSRGAKVADDPDDREDEVAEDDDENKVADESEESDEDKVTGDDDDDKVTDDDDDKVADDEDEVADDDDDMPKAKAERKVYAAGRRAGVKAGIKSARKSGALIAALVDLAEKPASLVGKFIAKGVSVDDVRDSLLEGRASKSSANEISGLRNPNTTSKQIDTAAIYAKYNGSGVKARHA